MDTPKEGDTQDEGDTRDEATTRSDADRHAIVAAVIAAARPDVQRDGGDIVLVAIDGAWVRVRLSGACIGCAMAGHTLGGIRRRLMQALGEPVRVVPG